MFIMDSKLYTEKQTVINVELSKTNAFRDSVSMEDDTDVDALGVPPRLEGLNVAAVAQDEDTGLAQLPQGDNVHANQITDGENSSVLSDVSKPHEHWTFNHMLLDISKALATDEFIRMKSMYEGEFGYASLEKITSPRILFTAMRKRQLLSSINLLELGALLHFAGRNDLLQSVAEYSKKTENALYLHLPTHTPVKGYRFLEFHVMGRDFTKTTRKELLNLRNIVCGMLGIPERFVIIDGVSPSSSITITLLLPEKHATKLQNMIENKEMDVIHLIFYGVDTVVVGDKKYTIQDTASAPTDDKEQQQLDMYQQLQIARSTLSKAELENLTLHEKIERLENKVMELEEDNKLMHTSQKSDLVDLGIEERELFCQQNTQLINRTEWNRTEFISKLVHSTSF